MAERLAFLLDGVPEAERMARCRELRALALVYCGLAHPATEALGAAITDPAMTGRALIVLDALPALRRRRLLASYGALMGVVDRTPPSSATNSSSEKCSSPSRSAVLTKPLF
jgi:hypothetical protein